MSLEQREDFLCPYCGEVNELFVDIAGGVTQEFVVDCEICCAPIVVRLKMNGTSVMTIEIKKEND